MTVHELIEKYVQSSKKLTSIDEGLKLRKRFIQDICRLKKVEAEINDALKMRIEDPCQNKTGLWILAAMQHPSKIYLSSLFILLRGSEYCVWHEGILDVFENILDESMIPHLEYIVNRELLNDPGRAAAILALELLIDIGTDEAWQVIKNTAHASSSDVLREEAREFIKEYRHQ